MSTILDVANGQATASTTPSRIFKRLVEFPQRGGRPQTGGGVRRRRTALLKARKSFDST
jgi:hypothetical protein